MPLGLEVEQWLATEEELAFQMLVGANISMSMCVKSSEEEKNL